MMSVLLTLLDFREPVNAWSHCTSLLLSIPATFLLWRRAGGDLARRISLLVFGVSLAICYAGSTLFHAVRLSQSTIDLFDELDHIGIFILIAGSYTPVAWNLLHGRLKWGTLATAWLACATGTALFLICGVFSMFWSTLFYLAMGWGAVICYVEIARFLSHRTLFPLLLGGILYSVGAVFNLAHWPVIWPGVFGPHELFHLFVMGGSFCHFMFMLEVVARPHDQVVSHRVAASSPQLRVVLLSSLTSGSPATGVERLSDPRIPQMFRPPLYLNNSPDWRRQDGF
jgi:hemolysin III